MPRDSLSPKPGYNGLRSVSSMTPRPSSEMMPGRADSRTPEAEQIDQWFQHLASWETTLEEMAAASTDQNFTEELGAIEQCRSRLKDRTDVKQGSASSPRLNARLRSTRSSSTRHLCRFASFSASSITWPNPIPWRRSSPTRPRWNNGYPRWRQTATNSNKIVFLLPVPLSLTKGGRASLTKWLNAARRPIAAVPRPRRDQNRNTIMSSIRRAHSSPPAPSMHLGRA